MKRKSFWEDKYPNNKVNLVSSRGELDAITEQDSLHKQLASLGSQLVTKGEAEGPNAEAIDNNDYEFAQKDSTDFSATIEKGEGIKEVLNSNVWLDSTNNMIWRLCRPQASSSNLGSGCESCHHSAFKLAIMQELSTGITSGLLDGTKNRSFLHELPRGKIWLEDTQPLFNSRYLLFNFYSMRREHTFTADQRAIVLCWKKNQQG